MSADMILAAVMFALSFLLALLSCWLVLSPIWFRNNEEEKPSFLKQRSNVEIEANGEEQRNILLDQLAELEFDFRSGKIEDEDYRRFRNELENRISAGLVPEQVVEMKPNHAVAQGY